MAAICRSDWITLIVVSSVGLIPMYGETVIIPAIPDIIKEFGITYSTSSWILASFLIAGAVMTPISGKLSDIYGKKKIVLIIMCIYTVGVALGGFASNISFMIIARILQGVGISMFPIAFGIIKLQFPKEKFSIAQGIFTGVFTAGSAIGLALGGTIIYHYGWHFALLSMVLFTLRKKRKRSYNHYNNKPQYTCRNYGRNIAVYSQKLEKMKRA